MTSKEETARALTAADWRTSSYSDGGQQCVEVATNLAGVVPVRDSKDREGPSLVFPAASFASFIHAVNDGEFGTV